MEKATPYLIGAGLSAVGYPITYAKTLVQIGYEPISPVLSSGLFGGSVYLYPNMFKYAGLIYKTDGFFGLYRGFFPRIISNIIGNIVVNSVHSSLVGKSLNSEKILLNELDEENEVGQNNVVADVEKLAKDTAYETISRCAGVIISQPFYVISIRSMAQFIGKETEYRTIFSSVSTIWKNEGILGFFVGLVPRLLCEMLTIWIANVLSHSIQSFIFQVNKKEESKSFVSLIANLIATQITYPFALVSVVMSVNNSGLSAGSPILMPTFNNWSHCMTSLSAENQMKRGSSLFWRRYSGSSRISNPNAPVIMPPIYT